MSSELPGLLLSRHGDPAWIVSRRHTGRTDLPLIQRAEEHARQLGERPKSIQFVSIFTYLSRSLEGRALSSIAKEGAEVDPDMETW